MVVDYGIQLKGRDSQKGQNKNKAQIHAIYKRHPLRNRKVGSN